MENYNPTPLDTNDATLPEELNQLAEQLAANVHEVWAKGRLDEGWTYGAVRSDAQKKTPCLVPYDDLPENEKEYDRNTAMQTLKAIVKLGYTIVPPQGDTQ